MMSDQELGHILHQAKAMSDLVKEYCYETICDSMPNLAAF
jgi:hypothetical protein